MNWSSEFDWVAKISKRENEKAEVLKMCFTAVLYMIWKERNNRIYNSKEEDQQRILRKVKYLVLLRSQSMDKIKSYSGKFEIV